MEDILHNLNKLTLTTVKNKVKKDKLLKKIKEFEEILNGKCCRRSHVYNKSGICKKCKIIESKILNAPKWVTNDKQLKIYQNTKNQSQCTKCGIQYDKRRSKFKYSNYCNECSKRTKYELKLAKKYRDEHNLKLSYCEICLCPDWKTTIQCDHIHGTAIFRGNLCVRCNTYIGLINDNPEIASRMFYYLSK